MNTRAVFYTEGDARAVVGRLVGQGFTADVARERFAGEDDDEDQVDRRADGNAVHGAAALVVRPPPLELPEAPKRIKNHFPRD